MEFDMSFAALSENPHAGKHFRKFSTPPMTVSDLVLLDEVFLTGLRVGLFDVVPKEVFGWTCSIIGSAMLAFGI